MAGLPTVAATVRGMRQSELVDALRELPALRVEPDGPALLVAVPGIDDSLRLYAESVLWHRPGSSPEGARFLQLVVRQHDQQLRLVLLNDDILWEPPDVAAQLDTRIPVRVTDAPEIVAYTELKRVIGAALRAADEPAANLDGLAATLLISRSALVGALRLGLRPLRAVRLWHELWCRVGEFAPGPFWPDPDWDGLLGQAGVPLAPYEQDRARHRPAEVEALTVADLRSVEPALTVSRADERLLAAWRLWMKLTPRQFCEVLSAGLPEATMEVSLYADGGGAVSLRVVRAGVFQALLELRLSFTRRWTKLDEIRVADEATGTGLFQQLMSNVENLSRSLGMLSIKVYATGLGSYVFARDGFDWDLDPVD